eukprot:3288412-Rhodomonas_salina.2
MAPAEWSRMVMDGMRSRRSRRAAQAHDQHPLSEQSAHEHLRATRLVPLPLPLSLTFHRLLCAGRPCCSSSLQTLLYAARRGSGERVGHAWCGGSVPRGRGWSVRGRVPVRAQHHTRCGCSTAVRDRGAAHSARAGRRCRHSSDPTPDG